jgi:hypothetical protein
MIKATLRHDGHVISAISRDEDRARRAVEGYCHAFHLWDPCTIHSLMALYCIAVDHPDEDKEYLEHTVEPRPGDIVHRDGRGKLTRVTSRLDITDQMIAKDMHVTVSGVTTIMFRHPQFTTKELMMEYVTQLLKDGANTYGVIRADHTSAPFELCSSIVQPIKPLSSGSSHDWRLARFDIGSVEDGPQYKGYHNGSTAGGGWYDPWFPEKTAIKVLKDYLYGCEAGKDLVVDYDNHIIRYYDQNLYDENPEYDSSNVELQGRLIRGKWCYNVGEGGWVWDKAEDLE